MGAMVELTDANFESEVIQADGPVLVDFWGPSCGPCRMLMPVLEQLAGDNAGKIKIGKVNVNENFGIAAQYQVQLLPTLLFFKGGDVVKSFTGAQPANVLQKAIDELA